jgi:hypothetical protein
MVLEAADGGRMLFVFRGRSWGTLSLALSVAAISCTSTVLWAAGTGYRVGGVVASSLVITSTLHCWLARRRLEILLDRGIVRYTNETLVRSRSWEKSFAEFEAVVVAPPARRDQWGFGVLLRTRGGEHLLLGNDATGWSSLSRATALAHEVAERMALPVVGGASPARPKGVIGVENSVARGFADARGFDS